MPKSQISLENHIFYSMVTTPERQNFEPKVTTPEDKLSKFAGLEPNNLTARVSGQGIPTLELSVEGCAPLTRLRDLALMISMMSRVSNITIVLDMVI